MVGVTIAKVSAAQLGPLSLATHATNGLDEPKAVLAASIDRRKSIVHVAQRKILINTCAKAWSWTLEKVKLLKVQFARRVQPNNAQNHSTPNKGSVNVQI